MMRKGFLVYLVTALMATSTAAAVASKSSSIGRQLHHHLRSLHNCVIPLDGLDSQVQAIFDNTCTTDLNGVGTCQVAGPANLL